MAVWSLAAGYRTARVRALLIDALCWSCRGDGARPPEAFRADSTGRNSVSPPRERLRQAICARLDLARALHLPIAVDEHPRQLLRVRVEDARAFLPQLGDRPRAGGGRIFLGRRIMAVGRHFRSRPRKLRSKWQEAAGAPASR